MTRRKGVSPTIKLIIVLVIMVGIGLGYYYGIYTPTSEKITELEQSIETTQQQIELTNQKNAKMVAMQEKLKDEEFTKQVIPEYSNENAVWSILQDFREMVDLSGKSSWSVDAKRITGTDYVVRPISLDFTAPTYKKALEYIQWLYDIDYATNITKLTISGNPDENTSTKVSLTLNFYEHSKQTAQETKKKTTTTTDDDEDLY